MGCSSCSNGDGTPNGCQNNGHCKTGGCNMRNTYDWFSNLGIEDVQTKNLMEVSFKNGASKDFYQNNTNISFAKGDMVAVEADRGYDIGQVSLSGPLVERQMKKKKFRPRGALPNVLRRAHAKDLERLQEARALERDTMIRSRAIIHHLALDMKLGDVQYQGDKRKCTFYYTAEGRVDFRELVRTLAREFRVKVEMRQIGARQESARIGGLGSCGRELCCSTWLSNFKSVSTSAARYQNLAINQAKLSGQCGRLKCCLNYELDTYLDAIKDFPKRVDRLEVQSGSCRLIKTDIFKRIMYYSVPKERGRNDILAIPVERVKEVQQMNKNGKKPLTLMTSNILASQKEDDDDMEFADVTGQIDLPKQKRRKKNKNRRRNKNRNKRKGNKPNNKSQKKSKNKSNRDSNNKSNQNKNSKSSHKKGGPVNKKRPPRQKKNNNKRKPPSSKEG